MCKKYSDIFKPKKVGNYEFEVGLYELKRIANEDTENKDEVLLDKFINIASDIVYLSFIGFIDEHVKFTTKVSETLPEKKTL